MAGRLIGDAYIAIHPDTDLFRSQADAQLKKSLAGLNIEAAVGADTKTAATKIQMLGKLKPEATATANADVAAATAKIMGLGKLKPEITASATIDTKDLLSKLAGLQTYLRTHRLDGLDVAIGADVRGSMAKVEQALIDIRAMVKGQPMTLDMQANVAELLKQVSGAVAEADMYIRDHEPELDISLGAEKTLRHVQELLSGVKAMVAGEHPEIDLSTNAAKVIPALAAVDAELKNVTRDAITSNVAVNSATIAWGGWGGAMGFLGTKIALFGGALDSFLPKMFTSVSVLHIFAEGILEIAAVWGPAILGLTIFGAVASETVKNVVNQFKSMNTAIVATGQSLSYFRGGLDAMKLAIQPQVLQLLGDFFTTNTLAGQHLTSVLRQIGVVLDDMGAKVALFFDKWRGSSFLQNASKDVAGLGDAFLQIGRIIHVFIVSVPGYAEILLRLGDAFLTLTANAVSALQPVIALFLKFHGAIFYIGLATTAILTFGRAFAAAAITTAAGNSERALSGAGAAALNWAKNFTSSSEKVAAEAGNNGSMISRWGQSVGNTLGTIVGTTAKAGQAFVTWITETRLMTQEFGVASTASNRLAQGIGALPGVTREAEGGFTLLGATLSGGELALAAGAVGVLAIAIGAVLYEATRKETTAAEQLHQKMEALIASSNLANVQQNIAAAIDATTKAISNENSTLLQLTGTGHESYKALSQLGPATVNPVTGGFSALGKQVAETNTNLNQNNSYLKGYIDQSNTVGQRTAALVGQFGNVGHVMGIMNLAGVKQSDIATANAKAWALDEQKIRATAAAYGFMGQQAGTLGNQIDTLNIQQGENYKAVQALTQAEQAWLTLITGGESAFTTFEQGQGTLSTALKASTSAQVRLSTTTGHLTNQTTALGASMTGTGTAALGARQAFDTQIGAAGTLFGNLQQLASASGNTKNANIELAKSGKDIVAQLLPMAKGSKQATSEVYALAQVVGYTGNNSFAGLVKWVGHTQNAEADLNTQQAKLTISASNLSQATKNLNSALAQMITTMQAAAIAKTANLGQATQNLATAFNKAHGAVNQMAISAAGEYVTALLKAGVSTQQAKQYLDAYLKQLGYTPSQIKAIDATLSSSVAAWQRNDAAVNQNTQAFTNLTKAVNANRSAFQGMHGPLGATTSEINDLWGALVRQDKAMIQDGSNAAGAQAQFKNFAVNGLHLTTTQANDLWQKFGQQNLDWTGGKAANTKNEFIRFAEDGLHLTANQAKQLWTAFALQNMDMLMAKGISAKGVFINLAEKGLDLTRGSAQALWNTMRQQYLDTLSQKAGETQRAFEGTAEKLGYTKQQADNLWASLRRMAGNYGVNVKAAVSGGGKVSATVLVSAGSPAISGSTTTGNNVTSAVTGQSVPAANFIKPAHHAQGGYARSVPGWGNHDSVPAMLMPGELVIPKNHAAEFAGAAKRKGIPGFATGGLVGSSFSGNPAEMTRAGQQLEPGLPAGLTKEVTKLGPMVIQELTQTIQAVQGEIAGAMGGAYGGPTSFGGGFESLAALLSYARYFVQNGMTPIAAAGMAATIAGEESSAGPESRGTGGFGLIGWTGNTVGLPPGYTGPTGNVGYDLQQQLRGVIGYMNSRGGAGPLNAAKNPVEAGNIWSSYEAPATPLSDTRPALANQIYQALLQSLGTHGGTGGTSKAQQWKPSGPGSQVLGLGQRILMDAEHYAGHPYHWGGASNPSKGWDCSSFASWVLGHDLGLPLPGGSWSATTNSGNAHGDSASQFLNMPGAINVGHNPNQIQAGDLLVWPDHVGFGAGPGRMFSAYGTAFGTIFSPAQASGQLTIMRLTGAGGAGAAIPGPITDTGTIGFNFAQGGLVGNFGAGGFTGMTADDKKNVAKAIFASASPLVSPGSGRPHSAGNAMVNEPVYGFGARSGIPYSFGENGPEMVVNQGQMNAMSSGSNGITSQQGNTTNQLLSVMVKLLQQMPYAFASGINNGAAGGVRHGYYGAQG